MEILSREPNKTRDDIGVTVLIMVYVSFTSYLQTTYLFYYLEKIIILFRVAHSFK